MSTAALGHPPAQPAGAARGAGTAATTHTAETVARLATLNTALADLFAPWVQALHLKAEALGDTSVTLRLPHSDQLSRVGGMLCGQAMMAAADTAMVLALIHHFGEMRPCTTVQLSTSFVRPLSNQDALVTATLVRVGKTMAFGEIDIRGADDGKSVCRASTTYALLG